jgi:hypothetical protein
VVAPGYSVAGVVGTEAKFYHAVFVAEPRVMVEALGFGSYFGEESKGRFEVGKAEAAAETMVGFGPHSYKAIRG